MSRTILPLCHNWRYREDFQDAYVATDFDDCRFTQVTLPHTNVEVPYNYFDETMSQIVSCYRNTFTVDEAERGKRLFLDFEGVMAYADVYLNGVLIGSHKGGYTQFSVDVTEHVTWENQNVLVVKVDAREREDIPPFGGFIDYLTFGGIYRAVSLRSVGPVLIENICVRPQSVLDEQKQVECTVFAHNTLTESVNVRLNVAVRDGEQVLAENEETVTIDGQAHDDYVCTLAGIRGVRLWELDDPALYTCEVTITSHREEAFSDAVQTRFGFRTAEFTPSGFLLNGHPLKLRGLNRHQTFPYVGQAMPARAQRKDADILKDELHVNIVRTSHYPQSRHFLDRCDEIGLLVLEEIPGWQYIGNDAWKQVACENVREMIMRDWNHPSIVMWGVRINESADDHDFYAETNRIAHELDPTRQTGGIRCITHSELLEDVYTINDFAHRGGEIALRDQQTVTGLDHHVPYLVTEFNGHMYPTKRFDQEERLVEHALRHVRVHNRAGVDEHICGGIGWCAFDYNTHYQFGSGDRICYHGVMDMFRLPKMAAHFYRSQVSPSVEPVLEPLTLWARGERNIGGVLPLVICTNCESVECYYGDRLVGKLVPDREQFPGLSHPPAILDIPPEKLGEWGMTWEGGRFVGYVNGEVVIEKHFVKNPLPTQLVAVADDSVLDADGIDVTRVVFTMVDQVGNALPYIHDFLKITLTGPADILGPQEVSLIGGCIAVWVKTRLTPGTISVLATSSRLQSNVIEIATR